MLKKQPITKIQSLEICGPRIHLFAFDIWEVDSFKKKSLRIFETYLNYLKNYL